MDKKKDTPAEVETVTVTMTRPVAEAVKIACEWYLRLHMGQFWDLAEDLCMAKFYSDAKHNEFKTKEQRDNAFTVSIHRRNDMQDEVYSGETSMKVWAYCADGTQHDAHYEIHDGNGQWFVEGKDDKFSEHGNVTHWMYYPAAPKD